MPFPRLVSVNVALPRTLEEKPLLVSGIDKLPRLGPVTVQDQGLEGDGVGDTTWHGGTAQAVYAFAQEDYDFWAGELGGPLRPGFFGDNLTTAGIDLNSASIGEQWRVGTARFQVTSVRTPCERFERWMGLNGHHSRRAGPSGSSDVAARASTSPSSTAAGCRAVTRSTSSTCPTTVSPPGPCSGR